MYIHYVYPGAMGERIDILSIDLQGLVKIGLGG